MLGACSVRIISTSSPTMRSPGSFTRTPMAMLTSGLMRIRTWPELGGTSSSNVSRGGRLNCTITSVAVTGSFLPARI